MDNKQPDVWERDYTIEGTEPEKRRLAELIGGKVELGV